MDKQQWDEIIAYASEHINDPNWDFAGIAQIARDAEAETRRLREENEELHRRYGDVARFCLGFFYGMRGRIKAGYRMDDVSGEFTSVIEWLEKRMPQSEQP